MKKTLIMLAGILILVGCSSTPKAFRKNVTAETKFYIAPINLTITTKCPAGENNLTNEEVQALFATDVKKHLCSIKSCTKTSDANDITVKVNVEYQRQHNGEAFGTCKGHYGHAKMTYNYTMLKNGTVFHSADKADLYASYGLFGNFKRIFVNIFGLGGKKEEQSDISRMTLGLADRISKGQ